MVGPGTGIAPFRSFMQSVTYKAKGKNWLFFGNPFHANFLYQVEWQGYVKEGLLTKLRWHFLVTRERYMFGPLLGGKEV